VPRPSANDSQLQVPPASVYARSAEVAFAAGTGARVGSALGAGVRGAGDALGDGVSAGEGMGEGEGAGVALERCPRPRPFGLGVGDAIVAAVGNGIGCNAGVGEGDGAGAVWPLCAISNRVPGAPLENPHNPTAAVATAKARVREKRRIPGILCFRIRRSSRGADRGPVYVKCGEGRTRPLDEESADVGPHFIVIIRALARSTYLRGALRRGGRRGGQSEPGARAGRGVRKTPCAARRRRRSRHLGREAADPAREPRARIVLRRAAYGRAGDAGRRARAGHLGHRRSIARHRAPFAKEGYIALAPDLYSGLGAPSGDGATDTAAFRPFSEKLSDDMVDADLAAAAAFISAGAGGARQKIGVVGFCMGGSIALRQTVDSVGTFAAAAVFYGKVRYGTTGNNGAITPIALAYADRIGTPLCGSWGATTRASSWRTCGRSKRGCSKQTSRTMCASTTEPATRSSTTRGPPTGRTRRRMHGRGRSPGSSST